MRTTCLTFLLIALTATGISGAAFAQVPLPQSKKEALGNLEARAQARKDAQKTLEKRAQEIETALGDTRKQLLNIASKVRGNEKILRDLEDKIEALETEQNEIQDRLEEGRLSISRLILALGRIRRVPPEAMLARPETPLKTAQSAMLIGDILPALTQQADALQADLKELEEVSAALSLKRDKALEASESLRQEHNALSTLVARREKLYASTQKDLKAQQEEAERISRQARNLQDLVRRLEEDKKKKLLAAQAQTPSPTRSHDPSRTATARVPTAPPKAGQSRLPVEGPIRISYDQPDNFGAPSKGLSIEGRSGALVVAPMGGIVRFAGHFKNHGNMVIIEHEKGFHSLVAGLGKIDTVVGQSVLAGEPLGLLDNPGGHGKPLLYYELRRNGKPVNPSVKFADLG
jgi:septal ring factor EnvC (AmiA/AmiB activator)